MTELLRNAVEYGGVPINRGNIERKYQRETPYMFKQILLHGKYLADCNYRNGRNVNTKCNGCERNKISRAISLGSFDLCMSCVNYYTNDVKFMDVISHGIHAVGGSVECNRCHKFVDYHLVHEDTKLCYGCVAQME